MFTDNLFWAVNVKASGPFSVLGRKRKKKAEEKEELMAKALSTTYSYKQKVEFCFRWEVVGETFDHRDQSESGPEGCVLNEIQNAWMSFSDWRYVALMLQDRLHKHLRNVAARKETAVRNERSHFPCYAQTGCHYVQWSLCVTSRWGPEWKRRQQRRKFSSKRCA